MALPEEEVGEAAAASASAGPVRGREGREEGAGPHTANIYEFEHKVYLKCVNSYCMAYKARDQGLLVGQFPL